MRILMPLAAIGLITACSTAPDPRREAYNARQLALETAGRTAGPEMRCLRRDVSQSPRPAGDDAIFFGNGSTTYRMDTGGGCSGLGRPGTVLVTESFASSDLCKGDFARVVDATSGMIMSSCYVGGFTPYTRAK